jgi:hypothetical protein
MTNGLQTSTVEINCPHINCHKRISINVVTVVDLPFALQADLKNKIHFKIANVRFGQK